MTYIAFLLYLIKTMMHTEIHTVYLGDSSLRIIKQNGRGKTLVHLHESEQTALEAAKFYIDNYGGSLITLDHSGGRNVHFVLQGLTYEFDPNRIFTEEGIQKTLTEFGNYSPLAHQQVKNMASKILSLLPEDKIIAVHNNYQDYSIKSYFPGQALSTDASAIYLNTKANHRNFYFVTQQQDYTRLSELQFNVALQAANPTDDGSLSYFYANKPYINVEAGYEERFQQLLMLENA